MKYTMLLGIGVVIVLLLAGAIFWSTTRPEQSPVATPTLVPQQERVPSSAPILPSPAVASPLFQPQSFTQTKAAHFVSSEPANNAVLTAAPSSVKINFNFDLAPPSKIAVTREGTNVTSGQATIAADKLSMSVPVAANQTGNYQVSYTACWPDKSCHDGSFGFSVQLIP